jgi:hypothetical protein
LLLLPQRSYQLSAVSFQQKQSQRCWLLAQTAQNSSNSQPSNHWQRLRMIFAAISSLDIGGGRFAQHLPREG